MESNIKSVQGDLVNCLNAELIIKVSHICFAIISAIFLKQYNPMLLFGVLSIILSFVSYNEKENIPIYFLFVVGLLMYLIEFIININTVVNIDTEKNNGIIKNNFADTLKKTMWKIPFYGILGYYIKLLCDNINLIKKLNL